MYSLVYECNMSISWRCCLWNYR